MPRKKPYTEELADWVRTRSGARQDADLVAFLAVRADVEAALQAGYTRKTIWEHMRDTGRTAIRYETFLRYVRRHCPVQKAQATPSGLTRPVRSDPPVAGFQFNPVPRKEDLV